MDGVGEPSVTTEKGLSKATSEALMFSPSQTMTEDQNVVEGTDLF